MLDSKINQNFNRSIVSPQFRANENASKPVEAEEKQGMSTTAKWAIGLGLTALASYGVYYALTKGRVKAPKPTPNPENPIPEIKEMAIDAFKRGKDANTTGVNRLVKGKAILADGTMYTGSITSTGKDGSKVVMEYVDGVLQKSTKTAKDGTKDFNKAYTWAEDGLIKEVKKNGETILDENKLIEIYKKANTELLKKDSLEGRFPSVIRNLEEIYADINKIEDTKCKETLLGHLEVTVPKYGYKFSNTGKLISKINLEDGLIKLRNQNKEILETLSEYQSFKEKFYDILGCIQHLDNWSTHPTLSKNNFGKNITQILDDLGYKFKDFDPKNYNKFYEFERYNEFELLYRAIVDKNGNTIAKGKVSLPENF